MPLQIKILNPDRLVFQGPAEYIVAPGVKGAMGVMPGHTPMFAELVKGDLYIAGQNEQVLEVDAGIMKVRGDEVTILIGIE